MISSEVQRTLVKSPPELWTELSDPAALGRHLGEFGEIRITRVEPEKTVEWEAERATGTVLIKPSGWGTRVTLRATRAIQEPEPPLASEPPIESDQPTDSEPPAQTGPGLDADPSHEVEPEPTLEVEPEPTLEVEPEPTLEVQPEPRRGFLSRLFGRRRREQAIELASSLHAADAERSDEERVDEIEDEGLLDGPPTRVIEPATAAAIERARERSGTAAQGGEESELDAAQAPEEPRPNEEAQDGSDISAELRAAEETAAEEVTAVLTSMLDRLGTAHHRPFSRG
jgi:hypothetical protein